MQGAVLTQRYSQACLRFFQWRCELAVASKIALAVGMACVTGLLAQIRIPLPWTPVPIVMATFGVILTGTLLGRWWGGVSMLFYAAGGAMGIPWFAVQGGLFGPTGGYIIGYILAALFIGHWVDTHVNSRRFLPLLGIMTFASLVLIYAPGLIQLGLWLSLVKGTPVNPVQLLWMGAIPFVIGDLLKSILAAFTANLITPRSPTVQNRNWQADVYKLI